MNDRCVSHMADIYGTPKGNRSEGWRCMFGAAVAPFIQTPIFILNSKYDTWQGAQIIRAGQCARNISKCPPNVIQFWTNYGNLMVESLDALPARHGVYVHNCPSHCQTANHQWQTDTINGTHMQDAVARWYDAAIKGQQATVPRHIDRCDVLPCSGDVCNGRTQELRDKITKKFEEV